MVLVRCSSPRRPGACTGSSRTRPSGRVKKILAVGPAARRRRGTWASARTLPAAALMAVCSWWTWAPRIWSARSRPRASCSDSRSPTTNGRIGLLCGYGRIRLSARARRHRQRPARFAAAGPVEAGLTLSDGRLVVATVSGAVQALDPTSFRRLWRSASSRTDRDRPPESSRPLRPGRPAGSRDIRLPGVSLDGSGELAMAGQPTLPSLRPAAIAGDGTLVALGRHCRPDRCAAGCVPEDHPVLQPPVDRRWTPSPGTESGSSPEPVGVRSSRSVPRSDSERRLSPDARTPTSVINGRGSCGAS